MAHRARFCPADLPNFGKLSQDIVHATVSFGAKRRGSSLLRAANAIGEATASVISVMATQTAKTAGARQLLQAILLLVMAGIPGLAGADEPANNTKLPVSKELVEYVREARRLGLPEQELKENARKAGWPASQINQALISEPVPAIPAPSEAPAAAAPAPATVTTEPKPATATESFARGSVPAPPAPSVREPRAEPRPPSPDDYRIGAGDVLQISVWDEPKASVANTVVRPDGRIGMPLLKEVDVVGLTPQQAEARITQRLSALIPNADVTVVVSATNSKKIIKRI